MFFIHCQYSGGGYGVYCICLGCLCNPKHLVQMLQNKTAVAQKDKEERNRRHFHGTRCVKRQWEHTSDVPIQAVLEPSPQNLGRRSIATAR